MQEAVAPKIDTKWLHASLPVTDVEAAAGFLDKVLGYRPVFGPVALGESFARLTSSDLSGARLMQLERNGVVLELIETGEPVTGWAHVAVAVADLGSALAAARAAGAEVAGSTETFAEGRSAYLRAPGGALIELEELYR